MANLFANPSTDLSLQIAPSIALDNSIVVTRYKSSTLDIPPENHMFFKRALFDHPAPTKVAVVAIAGTGHSPYPEAYIGTGMLTAAVTGATFMAPSPEAIRATLEFLATRASGILVICVNHQNDQFNVSDATRDFLKATPLCHVVVAKDEADPRTHRRQRGLAGVLFVIKLAGAAAEMGRSLTEVLSIARNAAVSVVTCGAASVTCSSLGRDPEMFALGRVQLGVGVHGESGEEEGEPTLSFKDPLPIIEQLFDRVHGTLERRFKEGASYQGEGLVFMLNNLGSMSPSEMLVARRAVLTVANERSSLFNVENGSSLPIEIYSGCFLSSLGAIGFSISGLAVWDKQWIELLHFDTDAKGWKAASCLETCSHSDIPFTPDFNRFERVFSAWSEQGVVNWQVPSTNSDMPNNSPVQGGSSTVESLKSIQESCILAVADALFTQAGWLTELDRRHGNGSLGMDAIRLGTALTNLHNRSKYAELATRDPVEILNCTAETARQAMQGSFGKFIHTFLLEMSSFLRRKQGDNLAWRDAFAHASNDLSKQIGNPRLPQTLDRSMMAALEPAAHSMLQRNNSLSEICDAAWHGCRGTRTRNAQGSVSQRSGALNPMRLTGFEDPGAWFVCTCLDAIKDVLERADE